ncbi:hypothetical protein ACP4OV_004187 [Aristida adscensionis]
MQQMRSLVPHVAGISPRLRAADERSFRSGRGRRMALAVVAGRARRVTAHVAAAPEPSGEVSLDQDIHASAQIITAIRKHEEKFFEVEMEVGDDDLDEYGVVNNAIYASYIHSGRDELLEKLGISADYWTSTGNAMAVSELNLKYFAPLRSGDKFIIKVRPVQIKGVRLVMHHLIERLPDRKLVLEATATIVCLNKDYRPTRVFAEVSTKAREVFACEIA